MRIQIDAIAEQSPIHPKGIAFIPFDTATPSTTMFSYKCAGNSTNNNNNADLADHLLDNFI